jgi:hypothetical protein
VLVGVAGFEPATPTSRTWCAAKLAGLAALVAGQSKAGEFAGEQDVAEHGAASGTVDPRDTPHSRGVKRSARRDSIITQHAQSLMKWQHSSAVAGDRLDGVIERVVRIIRQIGVEPSQAVKFVLPRGGAPL